MPSVRFEGQIKHETPLNGPLKWLEQIHVDDDGRFKARFENVSSREIVGIRSWLKIALGADLEYEEIQLSGGEFQNNAERIAESELKGAIEAHQNTITMQFLRSQMDEVTKDAKPHEKAPLAIQELRVIRDACDIIEGVSDVRGKEVREKYDTRIKAIFNFLNEMAQALGERELPPKERKLWIQGIKRESVQLMKTLQGTILSNEHMAEIIPLTA